MNVYVVLTYDQYYPEGNNIQGIFYTEEEATEYSKMFYCTYDYVRVEVFMVEGKDKNEI